MKNILFIILIFFTLNLEVSAEASKLVALVPKCTTISNNKVIIPVTIKSTNEGIISGMLGKYNLGSIYHPKEEITTKIINDSNYTINLDENRDSNESSIISLEITEDMETSPKEELLTFQIEYTFTDSIPSSIELFSNTIYLDTEEVCTDLNNTKEVIYLDNTKEDKSYLPYISYILNIILLITLIILIFKKKQ